MDRERRMQFLKWTNAAATYEDWLGLIRPHRLELLNGGESLLGMIFVAAGRWWSIDGTVDVDAAVSTIYADLGMRLVPMITTTENANRPF